MDINILPKYTRYSSSTTNLKFIRSATIEEICDRFSTYELQRNNGNMVSTLESIKKILLSLQADGYVTCEVSKTGWFVFTPTEKGKDPIINGSYNMDGQLNHTRTIQKSSPSLEESKLLSVDDDSYSNDFKSSDMYSDYIVHKKHLQLMRSAIQRKIKFTLSINDVKNLLNQRQCFYTGKAFADGDYRLSIDRLNADKGYEPGNVVACTIAANALKNKLLEASYSMFNNIHEIKCFVDTIYYGQHRDLDPLEKLLIK